MEKQVAEISRKSSFEGHWDIVGAVLDNGVVVLLRAFEFRRIRVYALHCSQIRPRLNKQSA